MLGVRQGLSKRYVFRSHLEVLTDWCHWHKLRCVRKELHRVKAAHENACIVGLVLVSGLTSRDATDSCGVRCHIVLITFCCSSTVRQEVVSSAWPERQQRLPARVCRRHSYRGRLYCFSLDWPLWWQYQVEKEAYTIGCRMIHSTKLMTDTVP